MGLFVIPLILGVGATVVGILWIFGLAIADTAAPQRHAPANTPLPGFIVPRWGAYRRGQVAREKALWDEDFKRAMPR